MLVQKKLKGKKSEEKMKGDKNENCIYNDRTANRTHHTKYREGGVKVLFSECHYIHRGPYEGGVCAKCTSREGGRGVELP